MDIMSWVVLLALLILLVQQIQHIRQIRLKAVISTFAKVALTIGIITIVALAYFFAKNMVQYCIAVIGILFVLVDCNKQGISDQGVLVVARGKELYRWEEIESALIEVDTTLNIKFYLPTGVKIAFHKYKLEEDAKIRSLLMSKGIKVADKHR